MMKYRAGNKETFKFIESILKSHGYTCVRADQPAWSLTGAEVINPIAVIYCCKYGIALFDTPEKHQNYNPNVAYELGIMHYQHKNCLILISNKIVSKKPFDLIGKLHSSYSRKTELESSIKNWVNKIEIANNESRIIALAVVKKIINKREYFLVTKRRLFEGNLTWGFPAREIRGKQFVKAIRDCCMNEMNIKVKVGKIIDKRVHPDTNVKVHYYLCEYASGRLKNNDVSDLEIVEWITGKEALKRFTSSISEEVKKILVKKY